MAQDFRPSRFEMRKLRKAMLEHAKLNGRVCKLIQPTTRVLGDYTTSDVYTYENAVKYPYFIHFQSEPPKKMLELFGWSKESTDAKPLLADCPMYRYPLSGENPAVLIDMDGVKITPAVISEGCLLEVETYDWTVESIRIETFEVEKVLGGDDKVNYIVSLVAHRLLDTGATEVEKPDSGSSFIKQSDE